MSWIPDDSFLLTLYKGWDQKANMTLNHWILSFHSKMVVSKQSQAHFQRITAVIGIKNHCMQSQAHFQQTTAVKSVTVKTAYN